MRNLTLFPMQSYTGKIAGLVVIGASLLVMLVIKVHGPLPLLSNRVEPTHQFDLFFSIAVFGMYLTAFSKEKDDDERVKTIRSKAMQSAFMMLTGCMLAIAFVGLTTKGQMDMDSLLICQVCGFVLALYLILFHIGLYFDPSWSYNDDTVVTNFKKNKMFFIIYTAVAVAFFLALFLIHWS